MKTGLLSSDGYLASSILATDSSKEVITLSTATYPSLTELSYIKGLTSAVQTQLNSKQSSLTLGNFTETTSSVLTITGGTGAIIGSGLTLQVKQASSSVSGYLSSTDWTTFNNKGSGTVTSISSGTGLSGGTITSTGTISLDLTHANTWTGQQTFNTSAPIIGTATASTIAGFDASKNLITLATATYPSLTELSYVKGVTSAIQTQLNAKGTYTTTFTNATLSAGVLTVMHNLGIQQVLVAIYDNNNILVIPDTTTLTSSTVATVDLTSFGTLTGTWTVLVSSGGTSLTSMSWPSAGVAQSTGSAWDTSATGTTGQVVTWTDSTHIGSTASNLVGGMTLVATASPSAVSSVTISSLSPGVLYRLIVYGIQNTSGAAQGFEFNSDTGNNYTANGVYSFSGSVANKSITTGIASLTGAGAGQCFSFIVDFTTASGNNKLVQFHSISEDSRPLTLICSGTYNGGSNLSTITVIVSAGTMTGRASLYKLN